MKLLFGFLAIFLAISFGEGTQNSAKLTGPIPCSTNASETWVDVVLLIDNSVNMGSSNLRKISTLTSLVMSKFPIGTNPNVTQGVHNTRVGVIAYNYKASIVAGFNDIKNLNDLAQVLSGIQLSSNKEANLYDAIIQSKFLEAPCTVNFCVSTNRPTVMIFFAAASNVDANSQIVNSNLIDTVTTTIITVNFNSADSNLTSLLNTMTFNYFVNTSMYNYSSSSSSVAKDLEWAILQGNCYCIDHTGYPLILYDSANNRYTRYAECMILLWTNGQMDGYYENPIEACTSIGYFPNFVMTGFLTSKDEEQFLAGNYMVVFNQINEGTNYPFYIGYHRNAQNNWVWYDYNLNDIEGTGYTNWASGYPLNDPSKNCTVIDSNDGVTTFWKNVNCNTQFSLITDYLCFSHMCDADSYSCLDQLITHYSSTAEDTIQKHRKGRSKTFPRLERRIKESQNVHKAQRISNSGLFK